MKKEDHVQKLMLATIHATILLEVLEELPVKQLFKRQTRTYVSALESNFLKLYDTLYQNDEELLLNLTKKHEKLGKWIATTETGKVINLISEIDKAEYDGKKKLYFEKLK